MVTMHFYVTGLNELKFRKIDQVYETRPYIIIFDTLKGDQLVTKIGFPN